MISLRAFAMPLFLAAASVISAAPIRAPNGHYYELVAAPNTSWTTARALAEARTRCGQPGHLVTVTSLQEQNWLTSTFGTGATGLLTKWMGAIQPNPADDDTGWTWVTGEPFSFTQWNPPNEPNNLGLTEDAGVFWTNGNWNDAPRGHLGYTAGGYVVEWDVDATVIIGGCDSGVINIELDSATHCTISDLIYDAAASATNHGDFVRQVAEITNSLRKAGLITGEEKGRIQSCAAQSAIP